MRRNSGEHSASMCATDSFNRCSCRLGSKKQSLEMILARAHLFPPISWGPCQRICPLPWGTAPKSRRWREWQVLPPAQSSWQLLGAWTWVDSWQWAAAGPVCIKKRICIQGLGWQSSIFWPYKAQIWFLRSLALNQGSLREAPLKHCSLEPEEDSSSNPHKLSNQPHPCLRGAHLPRRSRPSLPSLACLGGA